MKEYDIFISYRRDGGFDLAQVIYEKLSKRGYRVFMDIESLRSGKFNEKLFTVISECTDFILILSPHSLDRCRNEGDWVRTEIEFAIEKKKNIIPIQASGFTEPDNLPGTVKEVLSYNRILPTHALFNEAMDKMCREFIHSKTSLQEPHQKKKLRNIDRFVKSVFLLGAFLGAIELILARFKFIEITNGFQGIMFLLLPFLPVFLGLKYKDNNLEFLEEEFEGRNFNLDIFSEDIDSFVNKLMQIEYNVSSKVEVFNTEFPSMIPKADVFKTERQFTKLFIGSLNGEQIDYVLWKPNEIFSFFSIGESTSIPIINTLLAENGFTFTKSEGNVLFYKKDNFELRIKKTFWNLNNVIEICRNTVPYSTLIPVNINFENLEKPYDEFMKWIHYMIEYTYSESCFSAHHIHVEDFFNKYQIFTLNDYQFEIGSCDGKRIDYFLYHTHLLNKSTRKQMNYADYTTTCDYPKIYMFGVEMLSSRYEIKKKLEQSNCICVKKDRKHLVYENNEFIISISNINFDHYLEIRRKGLTIPFEGIKTIEREISNGSS